jgi:hypothetical protein
MALRYYVITHKLNKLSDAKTPKFVCSMTLICVDCSLNTYIITDEGIINYPVK